MDVGDCRGLKTTRLHIARDAIKKKKTKKQKQTSISTYTCVYFF